MTNPNTAQKGASEMRGDAITVSSTKEDATESVPGGVFVNEEALIAQSSFPIQPEELIRLTKQGLAKGVGVDDASILADDFEFCAPVVGPLDKAEYLSALDNFKVHNHELTLVI